MTSSEIIKVVQMDLDQPYTIEPGWSLVGTCPVQVSETNWVTQPKANPSFYGETEVVQVAVPVARVCLVLRLTDEAMFNGFVTELAHSQSQCDRLERDKQDLKSELIEKDKQLEEYHKELQHVYYDKEAAQRKEKDTLLMFEEYKVLHEQSEESKQRMEKDLAKIRETLGSREMNRILEV